MRAALVVLAVAGKTANALVTTSARRIRLTRRTEKE
jgi:hypothetical protein